MIVLYIVIFVLLVCAIIKISPTALELLVDVIPKIIGLAFLLLLLYWLIVWLGGVVRLIAA